ncbi:MAG: CHAD domain-containing protein [Rhodospirillaceae bacterium]|nr:CHAD domain-containing protein [Rhodospirillaceae bacterium]
MRARAAAGKALPAPPVWHGVAAVSLNRDAGLDRTIAAVVKNCRDHWRANVAAAADGGDPEGIHQVRVALRRLRSALGLFKHHIPRAQRTVLAQEAKWLLGELGAVRDLDVFINVLAADFTPRVARDEGFAHLIRHARLRRDAAQASAASALSSARARRFAARLDTWLEGHGWCSEKTAADAADFARHALNRRLRKIKGAAAGIAKLPVPERHELRIAVKKARYGIEFFHDLLPQKHAQRWATALKYVQDSLGHMNDLDVAERTIERLAGPPAEANRRLADAARDIRRMHKKAARDAEPYIRKKCKRLARIALF